MKGIGGKRITNILLSGTCNTCEVMLFESGLDHYRYILQIYGNYQEKKCKPYAKKGEYGVI